MDKDQLLIRSARYQKEYLKDLFISAVVLSSCVNFLATGTVLFLDLEKSKLFIVIISIFIIAIVMISYFIFKLKVVPKSFSTTGIFIYNKKDKNILHIDGYGISYDMYEYLTSALREEHQLKKNWDLGGLEDFETESEDKTIINELVEYCILQKLSANLTDYFQTFSVDSDDIFEVNSENIESRMLSNRFLKLFSSSLESRVEIEDKSDYSMISRDGVIYKCTQGGYIYEKTDFLLPKDSQISRVDANSIVIRMPMFNIYIGCYFYGINANLPKGFSKYYLKIKDYFTCYSTMGFDIEVQVDFKARYYFSESGWKYHEWVDKFIENIENYASSDLFFKKINWDTVYTIIKCGKK